MQYKRLHIFIALFLVLFANAVTAKCQQNDTTASDSKASTQNKVAEVAKAVTDTMQNKDIALSKAVSVSDSLLSEVSDVALDTTVVDSAVRFAKTLQNGSSAELKIKTRWIPDPKKAMWLAIAFPGGGQIYNRKYWKLPIIYGGFLGCFYALTWNNTMYRDYSQAYIDIMDSDDNTKSYMNFIPSSYNVESNLSRLQDLFKRKKNYFRRYRDMSMFCMIGVYLISIIDAYVDAEMSSFDISKDLSLKVTPAVINDRANVIRNTSLNGSSYGFNCSLKF